MQFVIQFRYLPSQHFGGKAQDLQIVLFPELSRHRPKNTGASGAVSYTHLELIAKRADDKGVSLVVFDRGGYIYHGRVKELAEGAREGGLKF